MDRRGGSFSALMSALRPLRPLLALLALLALGPAVAPAGEVDEAALGRTVGASPLIDPSGEPVDVFAVEEGAVPRATVLLFTRTDCPISNRYGPELSRLEADFAARGVAFFLVYSDPAESVADITTQREAFDLPFPALLDRTQEVAREIGATVNPEVAVLDGERRLVYRGRIDDRWAGFGQQRAEPTRHDLREVLTALLGGRELEPRATRAIGCYIPFLSEEAKAALAAEETGSR